MQWCIPSKKLCPPDPLNCFTVPPTSGTKFSHGSPWPAFTKTVSKDSVVGVEEKPGALKVKTSTQILCSFFSLF